MGKLKDEVKAVYAGPVVVDPPSELLVHGYGSIRHPGYTKQDVASIASVIFQLPKRSTRDDGTVR